MRLSTHGMGVFSAMLVVATGLAAASATRPGVTGVEMNTSVEASAATPGVAITVPEKDPPAVLATTFEAELVNPPDLAVVGQEDSTATVLPAAVSSTLLDVAGAVQVKITPTILPTAVPATPPGVVAVTVQNKNPPIVSPTTLEAVPPTQLDGAVAVEEALPTILPAAVSFNPLGVAVTDEEKNTPAVLPKTKFSSKMRVVLVIGVRGTGNKYFLQVSRDLFGKNDHLVRLPDIGMTKYLLRSSVGSDVLYFKFSIRKARTEMRKVARRGADLPFPGTVTFIPGKYSYPDKQGPKSTVKHVDLRLLAEIAEAEGVDFRVVYLRRPVNDVIRANTSRRQFQDAIGSKRPISQEKRFMEYMQFLSTDIAVVHSFLAELDPAFIVCHDFEHVGEVEQSGMVADFLAPNADVAEPLKQCLIDVAAVTHGASNESLPFDRAELVVAGLQRELDAFESRLCTGLKY